jgi:hypothetical protein
MSSGQAVILMIFLICSCTRTAEDVSVTPPPTSLLSRQFIGYGVISSSYIHITGEPAADGVSLGYLRMGSIVRVLERRSVNTESGVESWVLVDDIHQGWLREDQIQVYDSEAQAKTAAEILSR